MSARTWPARGHPRRIQADARRHRLAAAGQPWLRSLALLAIIVMLTWLGFTQLRTPETAPLTAPASAFSAERAMVHLDVIAADSRAIGMPGGRRTHPAGVPDQPITA
jgi:hypothetical protein